MGKDEDFTKNEIELIGGIGTTEHLTDLGNCKRFMTLTRGRMLYAYDMGKWMYYDGKSWNVDRSDKKAALMAELTVRSIDQEAADCESKKERGEIREHARKSESAQKIRAMKELAKTRIPVDIEEFDPEPWFLNCQNGVVDLRTGQLLEHDHEYMIDKILPVRYDPKAECPEWEKFIDTIMMGDEEMKFFLQKAVGYSLTGHTDERALFILHGSGKNGKSTFTETVAKLLSGYARKIASDALLLRKYGDDAQRDLAPLRAVRFLYASETAEGRRLNENKIKELTGDRDTVEGRFLYREKFDYVPRFKVFVHTNHRPTIRGTDNAIWDRIRLIPFNYRFEETIPRREVDAMFAAEMEGILRWSVDGNLFWQSDGLKPPEPVLNATKNYRVDSDILGEFFEDRCIIEDSGVVVKAELYRKYKEWAEETKEKPVAKNTFGNALMERGFDGDHRMVINGTQERVWKGIALAEK